MAGDSRRQMNAAGIFKRIAAGFLCAVMMLTGLPSDLLQNVGLIDEVLAEEKEITILDGAEERTVTASRLIDCDLVTVRDDDKKDIGIGLHVLSEWLYIGAGDCDLLKKKIGDYFENCKNNGVEIEIETDKNYLMLDSYYSEVHIILEEGADFNLTGDYGLKLNDLSYGHTTYNPKLHFYTEVKGNENIPGTFKANIGEIYGAYEHGQRGPGVFNFAVHSGNVTLNPTLSLIILPHLQMHYTVSGGRLFCDNGLGNQRNKVNVLQNGTVSSKNYAGIVGAAELTFEEGGTLEISEDDTIDELKLEKNHKYHFLKNLNVKNLNQKTGDLSVEGKLKADQSVVITGNGTDEVKLKAESVETAGDLSVESALLDIKESIKVGGKLHAQNAKISSYASPGSGTSALHILNTGDESAISDVSGSTILSDGVDTPGLYVETGTLKITDSSAKIKGGTYYPAVMLQDDAKLEVENCNDVTFTAGEHVKEGIHNTSASRITVINSTINSYLNDGKTYDDLAKNVTLYTQGRVTINGEALYDLVEYTGQTELVNKRYRSVEDYKIVSETITVSDDAQLLIDPGKVMAAMGGIEVQAGKTLTILSHTDDSGKKGILIANGKKGHAGIGGEGSVVLDGVDCGLRGGYSGGAGIGCANSRFVSGHIEATGNEGGAGIGGCEGKSAGNIVIEKDAEVIATGGDGAAGIGTGKGGSGGSIQITGVSSLTAQAGAGASSGIGAGTGGSLDKILIEDSLGIVSNGGDGKLDSLANKEVNGVELDNITIHYSQINGVFVHDDNETGPSADDDDESGTSIFDQTGIKNVAPEGFDEKDNAKNPFGKPAICADNYLELLKISDASGSLYAHNGGERRLEYYDEILADSSAIAAAYGGNFDGNRKCRVYQYALVYVLENNVYLGTRQAIGMDYDHTDIKIGEVSTFFETGTADRRQLKILTGDFDCNGYDDIAVYYPKNKSFVIYQLTDYSSYAFLDMENHWKSAGTIACSMGPSLSVAAGDFDNDGCDDLAFAGAKTDQGTPIHTVFGGKTDFLSRAVDFTVDGLQEAAVAAFERSTSRRKSLAVAGYIQDAGASGYYVNYYTYSSAEGKFELDGNNGGNVIGGTYIKDQAGGIAFSYIGGISDGTKFTNYFFVNGAVLKEEGGSFTNVCTAVSGDGLSGLYDVRSALTDKNQALVILTGCKQGGSAGCISVSVTLGSTVTAQNLLKQDSPAVYAFLNTDEDTEYIEYTGVHYVKYTNPRILAVLASPPYFKDLLEFTEKSGIAKKYADSETEYKIISGSGEGESKKHTVTSEGGFSVGFGADGEIGGIPLGIDFESKTLFEHGVTDEATRRSTVEYSSSYFTTVGQDMVVLHSCPYEIYEYNVRVLDNSGKRVYLKGYAYLPGTPQISQMSLQEYSRNSHAYEDLPALDHVVTHKIGDPSTYPQDTAGLKDPCVSEGDYASVGYTEAAAGSGSKREISITRERENVHEQTEKVTEELGLNVSIFGMKIGGSHTESTEDSSAKIKISTEGAMFAGTLQDMPMDAKNYGYSMNWKLLTYTGAVEDQSFPVITYLVKDVKRPPMAPIEPEQDHAATTDSAVGLKWHYPTNGAEFEVFRIYSSSGEEIRKKISAIPESSMEDGEYEYKIVDTNLNPDTEYKYRIQAKGSASPGYSMATEIVTARTKPSEGCPVLSLQGLDPDGDLTLYPDSVSFVKAVIGNPDENRSNIDYQWQKKKNGVWENISSATSETYSFNKQYFAAEGTYRCKVSSIYRTTNAIVSYTDAFDVKVQLRSAKEQTAFSAGCENNKPTAELTLIADHANYSGLPRGNVTFTISGNSYEKTYTVPIKIVNNAACAKLSDASVENLPEGKYTLRAEYGGSKVFAPYKTKDIVILSGTQVTEVRFFNSRTNDPDKLIYGDGIRYELHLLKYDGTKLTDSKLHEGEIEGADKKEPGKNYTFRTTHEDVTYSGSYTIQKRPVTVSLEGSRSVEKGNVEGNLPTFSIDGLPSGVKKDDLGKLIYRNGSGVTITMNNETVPGEYTVEFAFNESMDRLYEVSASSEKFSVTRTRYDLKTNLIGNGKVKIAADRDYENDEIAGKTVRIPAANGITVTAVPNKGYQTSKIEVKYASGKKEEFIGANTAVFNMPAESVVIMVWFSPCYYSYGIADAEGGSVICLDPGFSTRDTYPAYTKKTFTAQENPGWTFKAWQVLTEAGLTEYQDKTIEVGLENGNVELRALFEVGNLSLELDDRLQASVNTADSIPYGTEVTVSLKSGAILPEGAVWKLNGQEIVPKNGSYTFVLKMNSIVEIEAPNNKEDAGLTFTLPAGLVAGEALDKKYGDEDFAVSVSMQKPGINGTIRYVSRREDVATIKGDMKSATVSIHGAGTTLITAVYDSISSHAETSFVLNVATKDVSITDVGIMDKIYDGTTAAVVSDAGKIDGLLPSDEGKVRVSKGSAGFADASAGENKSVTLSGFSLTGNRAYCYHLVSQPHGKANINKKPLTIYVASKSIMTGEEIPDLSAPVEGRDYVTTVLLRSDKVTGLTLKYFKDGESVTPSSEEEAKYDIVPSDYIFSTGTDRNNYEITANTGVLEITAGTERNNSLLVTTNDEHLGDVTGSGTFAYGSTVTVSAKPKNGCSFTGWQNGSETVSTDTSYSFTLTENTVLTAVFEMTEESPITPVSYTVSLLSGGHGMVMGDGEYLAGSEATVYATPATGYDFVKWTENGEAVSTARQYRFTVESDRTLTAVFDIVAEEGFWVGGLRETYTYTGQAIKPDITVYYKNDVLTAGSDYTLSWSNNTKVTGKATVKVKFKGNYNGSLTKTFEIKPRDIGSAIAGPVSALSKSSGKSFSIQKLAPVLIYNGKALRNKTDYKLTYPDTSDGAYAKPGSYTIIVEGAGNFTGQREITEVIKDKSTAINLGRATVRLSGEIRPYNPGVPVEQKPEYELFIGNDPVPSDAYSTVYYNNVVPGTATVIFTAKEGGNYFGQKKTTFRIKSVKQDISDEAHISVSFAQGKTEYPYIKGGVTPDVVVKDLRYPGGGKTLIKGTDYTVSYSANKEAGGKKTPYVTVKGKGAYSGSKKLEFTISKQPMNDLTVLIDSVTFAKNTSAYKSSKVSVYDQNGKALSNSDYHVICDGIDNPGARGVVDTNTVVTLRVLAKSKNYSGSKSVTFSVAPQTLSGIKAVYKSGGEESYDVLRKGFIYRSSGVTPKGVNMTLRLKDGSVLTEGRDYQIMLYQDNKKTGKGKIIIQGLGDYSGVRTLTYQIVPLRSQ